MSVAAKAKALTSKVPMQEDGLRPEQRWRVEGVRRGHHGRCAGVRRRPRVDCSGGLAGPREESKAQQLVRAVKLLPAQRGLMAGDGTAGCVWACVQQVHGQVVRRTRPGLCCQSGVKGKVVYDGEEVLGAGGEERYVETCVSWDRLWASEPAWLCC